MSQIIKGVARACRQWDIPYLTFWTWSKENWKRDSAQVKYVMSLAANILTDPEKEVDIICGLPDEAEEQVRVPENFTSLPLSISPGVGFRPEDFGGVAELKGRSVFVNQASYALLESLRQKNQFTLRSITQQENFDLVKVRNFFQQLFVKGFLVPVNNEN